jgi:hypothetical protein
MNTTKATPKAKPKIVLGLVDLDPSIFKNRINGRTDTVFRPIPSNIQPYAAPRPALYRSPSPYARIATVKRNRKSSDADPSAD